MKNPKIFPLLTIILMSTMSLAHAQESNQSINSKLIEEYKTLIMEKMQTGHLVGVGAAIIIGDSVWKEGFGYADKENKIPFTTNTALCIGSITKVFTGMGIMQLHEKKQLNIDKPIVKYLPEFTIKTRNKDVKNITVRSVIQHTSGITNDVFLNAWGENEQYTKAVDYLKNGYLCYPVNMVYHYSNPGYSLLGHTILKVSREDYPDYVRDNILKPIGMNNSGFVGYHTLKNVSKTYDSSGTHFPLKYGRNIPAGGLLSNIDDMVKFAQEMIAIYHGKKGGFLKPETLKMFDENNNDNIENINTCFGWDVFKNDSSIVISHGGSHHVAVAMLSINLKMRIAAIYLVNTEGGWNLAYDALDKMLNLSVLTEADRTHSYPYKNKIANSISVDSLKAHAGIYADTRDCQVVKFENDKLILNAEYGNFELKPQTNNEFIPGQIINPDSVRWLSKSRFIFNEVNGYKVLFYQDANYKRKPLAYMVVPKEITGIWKKRLGKYKLEGQEIESVDKFSEAELSVADNKLLKLKVFYASGEYLYYMRIENDNELTFCGFDATQGGEKISFGKQKQNDIMNFYGLTMRKTN